MSIKLEDVLDVHNEFCSFYIYKQNDDYYGKYIEYLQGDIVSTIYYLYPINDLPDQLLIVLCELDNFNNLKSRYESLIWQLLDLEEYEL